MNTIVVQKGAQDADHWASDLEISKTKDFLEIDLVENACKYYQEDNKNIFKNNILVPQGKVYYVRTRKHMKERSDEPGSKKNTIPNPPWSPTILLTREEQDSSIEEKPEVTLEAPVISIEGDTATSKKKTDLVILISSIRSPVDGHKTNDILICDHKGKTRLNLIGYSDPSKPDNGLKRIAIKKADIGLFELDYPYMDVYVTQTTGTGLTTPTTKKRVWLDNINIELESSLKDIRPTVDKVIRFTPESDISLLRLIDPSTERVIETYDAPFNNSFIISRRLLERNATIIVRAYPSEKDVYKEYILNTTMANQDFFISKDFKYDNELRYLGTTVDFPVKPLKSEEIYSGAIMLPDYDLGIYKIVKYDSFSKSLLNEAQIIANDNFPYFDSVSSIQLIDKDEILVDYIDKDLNRVFGYFRVSPRHLKMSVLSLKVREDEIKKVHLGISTVTYIPGTFDAYYLAVDSNKRVTLNKFDITKNEIEVIANLDSKATDNMIIEYDGRGNLIIFNLYNDKIIKLYNIDNAVWENIARMPSEFISVNLSSFRMRDGKVVFMNTFGNNWFIYDPSSGLVKSYESSDRVKENLPVTVRQKDGSILRLSEHKQGNMYVLE